MTTATAGRHARVRPARSRSESPITKLLLAAGAVCAAVALAVLTAGGTYAFLNSTVAVAGATLTAGTASLSATPLALPATALYPLSPNNVVRGSATVTNTGHVPLQLRVAGLTPPATTTPFSTALTVGVGTSASAAACTAGNTPGWTGTFASGPAGNLPSVVVQPGASVVVCVTVTLPLTAPDGAKGQPPAGFAVLIDGRQV